MKKWVALILVLILACTACFAFDMFRRKPFMEFRRAVSAFEIELKSGETQVRNGDAVGDMEFKQRTLVGEDGPSCLAEHGRRALDQLAAGKETHARLNPAIRQFPGGTGDRIQAQAASAAVVVIDPVQSGIDQFLCVPQQIIHLGLAGRDAVFIIIDGIAEFGMMPFVLKDPVILPGIRAGRLQQGCRT